MEKIALLCILIRSIAAASARTGLSGGFRRERLMRSRMVALDLDPYELTLSDPALVRHLQRQCTLCKSREGCLLDLAHECKGAAWRDRRKWREYCPNASALDILIVLQSRSKTAPRYLVFHTLADKSYRFRWLVGGHYADQTAIKSAC
jgi:hypothetical protein